MLAETLSGKGCADELREAAVRRPAVQVVAEVATELAAAVRDPVGPPGRPRVEHDVRRFHARRGQDDRARAYLHLAPRVALDVRDAVAPPVVDEHVTDDAFVRSSSRPVRSASGRVNHVGEKNDPVSHPSLQLPQ